MKSVSWYITNWCVLCKRTSVVFINVEYYYLYKGSIVVCEGTQREKYLNHPKRNVCYGWCLCVLRIAWPKNDSYSVLLLLVFVIERIRHCKRVLRNLLQGNADMLKSVRCRKNWRTAREVWDKCFEGVEVFVWWRKVCMRMCDSAIDMKRRMKVSDERC